MIHAELHRHGAAQGVPDDVDPPQTMGVEDAGDLVDEALETHAAAGVRRLAEAGQVDAPQLVGGLSSSCCSCQSPKLRPMPWMSRMGGPDPVTRTRSPSLVKCVMRRRRHGSIEPRTQRGIALSPAPEQGSVGQVVLLRVPGAARALTWKQMGATLDVSRTQIE